jgi:hypothetical protein
MSRVWSFGHVGLVLLSVVTQALLCNLFVQLISLPLSSGNADDSYQLEV